MRRRILPFILIFAMLLSFASGCSEIPEERDGRISVIASIFPEYDWIRAVIGDEAERFDLTMLLDCGVDLHSYQPSADDFIKLSNCDLFVYTGGLSDSWVTEALENSVGRDVNAVNLLDELGDAAKEEEHIEGMQEKRHEEEEEAEYDEHIWLSLRNASFLTGVLAEKIAEIDPERKEIYLANAEAYQKELLELDAGYQSAVEQSSVKTLLFGDRFPFRYLADDYGLRYYAAFTGCSAETEASFETIAFLVSKVDELGLHAILQIETSDGSIARTIRGESTSRDQEILTLNSMQGIDSKDISDGVTYLSVMEDNLEVLKKAMK